MLMSNKINNINVTINRINIANKLKKYIKRSSSTDFIRNQMILFQTNSFVLLKKKKDIKII